MHIIGIIAVGLIVGAAALWVGRALYRWIRGTGGGCGCAQGCPLADVCHSRQQDGTPHIR